MTEVSREEALSHFGIKGMHWGVRKASDSSGSQKLTRKEVRAEKKDFYEKKGSRLVDTALKDPEVLIKLTNQAGSLVITGEQFVNHLSAGGMMNVKYTDIWATKDKTSGQYVQNAPDRYKKRR